MIKELVSVIIPVYNVEKYLSACLDSVINQTYKNLEIILVDDGSTDNSLKICENYQKIDSRIKFVHKKNGGVSSARNLGLKKCHGKFIYFIDSDDRIDKNAISELVKKIGNYSLAVCEYSKVDNNKLVHVKYNLDHDMTKKEFYSNILSDDKFGGYLWNKLYNAKVLKDSDDNWIFFDEKVKIMEDMLYNFKISSNIDKVKVVSLPLYFYNLRGDSAINSIEKNKDTTVLDVIPVLIDECQKMNLLSEVQKLKLKYISEYQRAKYVFKKEVPPYYFKQIAYSLKTYSIVYKNRILKPFLLAFFPRIYYFIKKIKCIIKHEKVFDYN